MEYQTSFDSLPWESSGTRTVMLDELTRANVYKEGRPTSFSDSQKFYVTSSRNLGEFSYTDHMLFDLVGWAKMLFVQWPLDALLIGAFLANDSQFTDQKEMNLQEDTYGSERRNVM